MVRSLEHLWHDVKAESIGATLMSSKTNTNTASTNTASTNTASTNTNNMAAATVERISDNEFQKFIARMRNAGKNSESAVQRVFLAVWRDVACSHSLVRLNEAYTALEDNPFKVQFSTAIRALAGAGEKDSKADALKRTGYNPLSYSSKEKAFTWNYDAKEAKGVKAIIAQNYKDFPSVHFRAVKLAKAKNVFTWSEVDAFKRRIETAKKSGNLYEKDAERLASLVLEIERLTNGN